MKIAKGALLHDLKTMLCGSADGNKNLLSTLRWDRLSVTQREWNSPWVTNHNQPWWRLIMTYPDIHKSQHLLKRLEEDMTFLSSLVSQALFVSTNVKMTLADLDRLHKSWIQDSKKSSWSLPSFVEKGSRMNLFILEPGEQRPEVERESRAPRRGGCRAALPLMRIATPKAPLFFPFFLAEVSIWGGRKNIF